VSDDAGRSIAPIPTIVVNTPMLVFGGCYSNLQATHALLLEARRLDIVPEQMICTGDVIAYGADPRATLALIREAGIATVMGNCEEALAASAEDCGCGFAPGSACDRLSATWFSYASRKVDAEDRRWMAALPRRIDLLFGNRRVAVVHGAPTRINRFIFASTTDHELAAEIAASAADGVIGGHCGLPFTRQIGSLLWHNSGAIGLPANDGTPRGWYSLLVPCGDGVEIRHLPLRYDHVAASRAFHLAGLPLDYAETIESGIWPSFDVLPPEEQACSGRALEATRVVWRPEPRVLPQPPPRFADRTRTAFGEQHAQVALERLTTLWFNTGTLCNIACAGCYIESSPHNDRLLYLSRSAFDGFLREAKLAHPELEEIGFTGGEPFMNPDVPGMIETALENGFRVLVLTNAMRPMQRHQGELARLHARFGQRLALRVSLDHYSRHAHEQIRGVGSFDPAIAGLVWLGRHGFVVTVAARFSGDEPEPEFRAGFTDLFREIGVKLDASDPGHLVLFPELTESGLPPEVGETCWQALSSRGRSVMCSTSRMVVHRKGEPSPRVVACTLHPYAPDFDLGGTLAAARKVVTLNHPHCARFCAFGQASCSARASSPPATGRAPDAAASRLSREPEEMPKQ
jgi:predicted phosphodiesterase